MSRGFSECCHYGDGYDDGFEDGKSDGSAERSAIVDALRFLAGEARLRFDDATGDVLAESAERLANDQGFEHRMEIEDKRLAELAKLYAEQKKVA